MVFKRRDREPFWNKVRQFFYPRKGWRRGFEYLGHRVKRLPDSPHKIALGLACGAFVSFSPLFGFHFFYAAILAWMLRGNVMASLIGTAVGNPLTFPFIAASTMGLGRWMLGRNDSDSSFDEIVEAFGAFFTGVWQSVRAWFGYGPTAMDRLVLFLDEIFLPYFLGGMLIGLVGALITYFVSRPLVAAYQARRRGRLMVRAKRRVAAALRNKSRPSSGMVDTPGE